jgi:hypothetical protein
MKYGTWGSRLPLINYISSNLIFLVLSWRRLSRLMLNFAYRILNKKLVPVITEIKSRDKIEEFLGKGLNKLNIGGGSKNLSEFINIDFVCHPSVIREIVANILDLSFIPDKSISHVHSNHVLEHLSETQIKEQLTQYRRILIPNGLLTFRCPNALGVCYGFLIEPLIEGDQEDFFRLGFPKDEDISNPKDKWMYKDLYGLFHWLYGDVGNPENEHLTLVTPSKVTRWLQYSGFELLKISECESVNIVVVARMTENIK